MGKICSNHLHFLSYLLKCPVDNAGNGISEPLNLKIFWRSMPPDGDPPYFGSPSDFQLFSFAYTFKLLRYTPEIYKNLGNLLFKTVSGGHFSSESLSTQLPLLWFRCKKGTSWNAAYYFENACSWKFHCLNVIHNRISWCKWHCFIQWDCNSFSETDIRYACHKCFEWKVLQCLKEESRITLGLPWRKNGWTRKTWTT